MYFCYIFLWISLCSATALFGKCPQECQRENTTLKCYGNIPNDACLTKFITEVIVLETTFVERFNFTRKGWKNVKSLSLNPERHAYHDKHAEVYKDLYPYEFEGLDNLEKLQISCRCLREINYGAFLGLNKLRVLDLSNNENLRLNSVQDGFFRTTLTNLSELYLSNSSRSVPHDRMRRLEAGFFQIIKDLPLKVFDMSGTQAWTLDIYKDVQVAFPVLEKLNVSNSGRLFMSLFSDLHPRCISYQRLRTIDLSYLDVPLHFADALFASGLAGDTVLHVPRELSEINIKNAIKVPIKLPPVTLNLTHLCFVLQPNKSNKFCLTGNGQSLKKVVVAENSLLYIDVSAMNCCPNVQYLDMSSNLLGEMISTGLIQSTLKKLLQLETLILSNNRIYKISKDSFPINATLRYLDLSYNNLESVTFDTHTLPSLRVLDLRYNKIAYLETLIMKRLSGFLNLNVSGHDNGMRVLKLTGNPFICTCEHVHGLQWLAQLNQGLVCKLKYEEQPVNDRLVKQVKYDCKLQTAISVYCSYVTIIIIVIGALIYNLRYEYKRFILRKQIKKGVQQYGERQNKQVFPVFLSFCCEDDEIVMRHIYPNLERGLQKILKTDAPCVATGYSTFRPGYSLAEEIIRCVEASSVVVFFVTNQFCRKQWCRHETLVANYENKSIILMLWEEIDLKLMPRYLYKHYRNHARVHWVQDEGGQRKMKPGWDELCDVIVSRFVETTE